MKMSKTCFGCFIKMLNVYSKTLNNYKPQTYHIKKNRATPLILYQNAILFRNIGQKQHSIFY